MEKSDKIYVAGHRGLVGSAIVRSLNKKGYQNVIGRTHAELNLLEQQDVRDFFEKERPDVVVLAAAKVGGINANNTTPAEFAYENMQIQCNVIKCCHDYKVKKLL
ncbi:MAG TPA: NAD-dependent epimerase/dehydratase family protein, partial [Lachnospiraceae bacterium]|nr:NAD-dependent epimerase/dehydratase family protein [Lachnospiraceae bacterium]